MLRHRRGGLSGAQKLAGPACDLPGAIKCDWGDLVTAHGAEFKAQFLVRCQQPGAFMAGVVLGNSLDVNLLRK